MTTHSFVKYGLGIATAVVCLLAASRAFAPGGGTPICTIKKEIPCLDAKAHELVTWQEGDSVEWVMRTDFGIVASDNRSKFLCRAGPGERGRPTLIAADADQWLVSREHVHDRPSTLVRSKDGCSFETLRTFRDSGVGAWAPYSRGAVVDWAVDETSGQIAYVSRVDEAKNQQILVSDDGGSSFEPLGLETDGLVLTGIAYRKPRQLIVSALRRNGEPQGQQQGTGVGMVFFRADKPDELAPVPEARFGTLLAAHGNQLVWRRVHWDRSQDRIGPGAPPEQRGSLIWGTLDDPNQKSRRFSGNHADAVFGPSGSHVWAASPGGPPSELFHGSRTDGGFQWLSVDEDFEVSCLDRAGDDVYLCGDGEGVSHHLYRRPVDGSGSAEGVYSFDQLEGYRSRCDDGAKNRGCQGDWGDLQRALELQKGDSATSGDGS